MVNQGNFKLRFQQAGGEWSEIPIPEGDLKIGRRSDCDLRLKGRKVSRFHADIKRRGHDLWIADLGSTHGTWVDGHRLAGAPQKLFPGQKITIGEFTLQVASIDDSISATGRSTGHIFISYSRRDQDLVYPLAQSLESDGFKVWIDRLDIPVGNPWRGEIVQAIAESDAFILFLTPSSTASENVLAELNIAIGEGIKILPVLLRPVKIPRQFKYQLSGLNRVDLLENPQLGYFQLTKTLREHQEYLAIQKVRPKRLDRQIEFVLPKVKLPDFNRPQEQQLLNFLAQRTGHSPSRFAVAGLVAGSVRLTVNMPPEAAYEIVAQALNKDAALLGAGISALRLDGHPNFIHIGGPPPPGGKPPDSEKTPPPDTPGGLASIGGMKWLIILVGVVAAFIIIIEAMTDDGFQPPLVEVEPTETQPTIRMTSAVPSTATMTPSVTSSVAQSLTPSPSPTGSMTPSPTGTRTPTNTPTRTATYTPTDTPSRTPTPTDTLTPTPWDITSPQIQEITIYQDYPCSDYEVEVILDIWDESAVDQVYYWLTDVGKWQVAERIDDYTYIFSIYAPNDVGSEYFYLSTRDIFGNQTPNEQMIPLKLYSGFVEYPNSDRYSGICFSFLVQKDREFSGPSTIDISGGIDPLSCQNYVLEHPNKRYIAYSYFHETGWPNSICSYYNDISDTIPNENAISGYIIYSP